MHVPIQAWILILSLAIIPSPARAGGGAPEFILQWGSNGVGNGQFSGPHGIEVDAEGNVTSCSGRWQSTQLATA